MLSAAERDKSQERENRLIENREVIVGQILSGLSCSLTMSELNDPRVLFAAERTLLAWSRTSMGLVALGFVLERFGLFLRFMAPGQPTADAHGISTWIGLSFIALGAAFLVLASRQYRFVLKSLRPAEIPDRYSTQMPLILNGMLLLMALVLSLYILYFVYGPWKP